MRALPPLALYIHIPWCVRKCPYCDFNSHRQPDTPQESAYIDALLADLDMDLPLAQERPLHSIFIGGGTPSLLSADAVERLMLGIQSRIAFSPNIEITMEANPGTLERWRFERYRQAGINRLSIGVQSFADDMLSRLGRIHSSQDADRAIESARTAGFDNINIDLMHGLPSQTPAGAISDLQRAMAHQPEHISWYQLTIEQNTEFYKRPPQLPEEESLGMIQDAGEAQLKAAGYAQYEVSAWSRPDRCSQHNLNYWQFGDYLGIGAGAHGKITHHQEGLTIVRTRKLRMPDAYLKALPCARRIDEPVEHEAIAFEGLMNALRLKNGIDTEVLADRVGCSSTTLLGALHSLLSDELLTLNHRQLRATSVGYRFLDTLLQRADTLLNEHDLTC